MRKRYCLRDGELQVAGRFTRLALGGSLPDELPENNFEELQLGKLVRFRNVVLANPRRLVRLSVNK